MLQETTSTTVLLVAGMRCNDCRERIEDVLRALDGVTDVQVSLFRAQAVVTRTATCDDAVLVEAVVRAGYGATVASAGQR